MGKGLAGYDKKHVQGATARHRSSSIAHVPLPPRHRCFIGTTGRVDSLKSSKYTTLLCRNASLDYSQPEAQARDLHVKGRDFLAEKLIVETLSCRAYLQASGFPIRTIGYVSDGI